MGSSDVVILVVCILGLAGIVYAAMQFVKEPEKSQKPDKKKTAVGPARTGPAWSCLVTGADAVFVHSSGVRTGMGGAADLCSAVLYLAFISMAPKLPACSHASQRRQACLHRYRVIVQIGLRLMRRWCRAVIVQLPVTLAQWPRCVLLLKSLSVSATLQCRLWHIASDS